MNTRQIGVMSMSIDYTSKNWDQSLSGSYMWYCFRLASIIAYRKIATSTISSTAIPLYRTVRTLKF